jgi:hypothetical protein
MGIIGANLMSIITFSGVIPYFFLSFPGQHWILLDLCCFLV